MATINYCCLLTQNNGKSRIEKPKMDYDFSFNYTDLSKKFDLLVATEALEFNVYSLYSCKYCNKINIYIAGNNDAICSNCLTSNKDQQKYLLIDNIFEYLFSYTDFYYKDDYYITFINACQEIYLNKHILVNKHENHIHTTLKYYDAYMRSKTDEKSKNILSKIHEFREKKDKITTTSQYINTLIDYLKIKEFEYKSFSESSSESEESIEIGKFYTYFSLYDKLINEIEDCLFIGLKKVKWLQDLISKAINKGSIKIHDVESSLVKKKNHKDIAHDDYEKYIVKFNDEHLKKLFEEFNQDFEHIMSNNIIENYVKFIIKYNLKNFNSIDDFIEKNFTRYNNNNDLYELKIKYTIMTRSCQILKKESIELHIKKFAIKYMENIKKKIDKVSSQLNIVFEDTNIKLANTKSAINTDNITDDLNNKIVWLEKSINYMEDKKKIVIDVLIEISNMIHDIYIICDIKPDNKSNNIYDCDMDINKEILKKIEDYNDYDDENAPSPPPPPPRVDARPSLSEPVLDQPMLDLATDFRRMRDLATGFRRWRAHESPRQKNKKQLQPAESYKKAQLTYVEELRLRINEFIEKMKDLGKEMKHAPTNDSKTKYYIARVELAELYVELAEANKRLAEIIKKELLEKNNSVMIGLVNNVVEKTNNQLSAAKEMHRKMTKYANAIIDRVEAEDANWEHAVVQQHADEEAAAAKEAIAAMEEHIKKRDEATEAKKTFAEEEARVAAGEAEAATAAETEAAEKAAAVRKALEGAKEAERAAVREVEEMMAREREERRQQEEAGQSDEQPEEEAATSRRASPHPPRAPRSTSPPTSRRRRQAASLPAQQKAALRVAIKKKSLEALKTALKSASPDVLDSDVGVKAQEMLEMLSEQRMRGGKAHVNIGAATTETIGIKPPGSYACNEIMENMYGGANENDEANNFMTCIVVLLNLIIKNKNIIDNITKKFEFNENVSHQTAHNKKNLEKKIIYEKMKTSTQITKNIILLKIFLFLILTNIICENKYYIDIYSYYKNYEFDIPNNIEYVRRYINNFIYDIYKLKIDKIFKDESKIIKIFSWSEKTQHIVIKNLKSVEDFIYQTISYILIEDDSNKSIKHNDSDKIINIDTTFIKGFFDTMITKYDETKYTTEYIEHYKLIHFFKQHFEYETEDMNQIDKILKMIQTHGVDKDSVFIYLDDENVKSLLNLSGTQEVSSAKEKLSLKIIDILGINASNFE